MSNCPLYTGLHYIYYSSMGKRRLSIKYTDLLYRGTPSKAGLTVHKMENFINSIFCKETILLNFNSYICSLINIQNIPHYINQVIIHAYQRRSKNGIHLNIFFLNEAIVWILDKNMLNVIKGNNSICISSNKDNLRELYQYC